MEPRGGLDPLPSLELKGPSPRRLGKTFTSINVPGRPRLCGRARVLGNAPRRGMMGRLSSDLFKELNFEAALKWRPRCAGALPSLSLLLLLLLFAPFRSSQRRGVVEKDWIREDDSSVGVLFLPLRPRTRRAAWRGIGSSSWRGGGGAVVGWTKSRDVAGGGQLCCSLL